MTPALHGLTEVRQPPPPERHGPTAGRGTQLRILGPVEIHFDGRRLTLSGPKQRTLLAVLAIHANRVVSTCQLVDALWDDAPPSTAIAQIHSHVSMLRGVLNEGPAGSGCMIVTHPPGYLLRVQPGQLDLDEFSSWTRQASEARTEGRWQAASDCGRAALALWGGPALGGASGRVVSAEAARFEEQRLAALEERIEADLALRRHNELVGELASLVAMHPLRERLRGQLMLALYRAGRQADALAVYQQGREALASELGLDPGRELRGLERRILADDPHLLATPEAAPGVSHPTVPLPTQLAPDIADFNNRVKETGLGDLMRSDLEAYDLVISVMVGKADVGKPGLVVHVTHRLRGAESQPQEAGEVHASFLRGLGVETVTTPDGVEAPGALFCTRLAGRQILVLLENSTSEGAGCAPCCYPGVEPVWDGHQPSVAARAGRHTTGRL